MGPPTGTAAVQSLPSFQGIVDPSFLQDQQENLLRNYLSQQSAIGTPQMGSATPGATGSLGGGGGLGVDPFQQGWGFDPSMLTSLFG